MTDPRPDLTGPPAPPPPTDREEDPTSTPDDDVEEAVAWTVTEQPPNWVRALRLAAALILLLEVAFLAGTDGTAADRHTGAALASITLAMIFMSLPSRAFRITLPATQAGPGR